MCEYNVFYSKIQNAPITEVSIVWPLKGVAFWRRLFRFPMLQQLADILQWLKMCVKTSQITGKSTVRSKACSVEQQQKDRSCILMAFCKWTKSGPCHALWKNRGHKIGITWRESFRIAGAKMLNRWYNHLVNFRLKWRLDENKRNASYQH